MINSRVRNVIIELTSLLDVVMILIFAVMIENTKLAEERLNELNGSQQELQELQQEYGKLEQQLAKALAMLDENDIEELLAQLSKDESRLDAYEHLDEAIIVFNIGLENTRYGNKILTYGYGIDDSESVRVELPKTDKENWKAEMNKFKVYLNSYLDNIPDEDNEKMICLIFTADPNNVYGTDYDDVRNAIDEMKDKYSSTKMIFTN